MGIHQQFSKNHYQKACVDNWKSSGKSARQWCQEHNISTSTFSGWKDKFYDQKIEKSSFVEISKELSTGITIKYKELEIHIDKDFDEQTLCCCLKIIKRISC